jgi:hypothetical protein
MTVPVNEDSQFCPKSKDGNGHCNCWWEGAGCCWCNAPRITYTEARELGWTKEDWNFLNEIYPPRKH